MRIYLEPDGRIGPGKIELLEKIAAFGSISAAGRALGMSYRRAWELVDEPDQIIGQPVTLSRVGGKRGDAAAARPCG